MTTEVSDKESHVSLCHSSSLVFQDILYCRTYCILLCMGAAARYLSH